MPTGSTTIDFGSAPGSNYASTTVTGQSDIATSSLADAWMMAGSTATHNAVEHMMAPIKLTVGNLVANSGFTIHAVTDLRLTGEFSVHWVWR